MAVQFAPAICLQWLRSESVHDPCGGVCHVNTLFHRCHCADTPASHIFPDLKVTRMSTSIAMWVEREQ